MTRSRMGSFLLALFAFLICAPLFAAAPPSENILPDNVKGFISAPNLDDLEENWSKTQIGQLADDEGMEPFIDSLREQIRAGGKQRLARLGLSWDDLRPVPTGEVAVAVTWDAPAPAKGKSPVAQGRANLVTIADITGNRAEAEALVKKMTAGLKREGGKQLRAARKDMLLYSLPARAGEKLPRQAAIYLDDTFLVVGDAPEIVEDIATAAAKGRRDNLADVEAFAAVMKRVAPEAGGSPPHLRWFIEPFGYADAAKALNPPKERRRGKDLRKALANQGFTAIQGFGGFVNFMEKDLEVLQRVAVHAPPVPGAEEKYKQAARMLNFPSGPYTPPPAWIPEGVSSYLSFNWNLKEAFEGAGSMVDEMANEPGTFEDVLESLAEERNGPKVNLRTELVANLGTNVTVVSDYVEPIDENSERLVFAVEVNNSKAVAEAIRKSMEADPGVRKRTVEGRVIWEIVEEQGGLPGVDVDNGAAGDVDHADRKTDRSKRPRRRLAAEDEELDEEERLLPHGAITVTSLKDGTGKDRDYLVVASHLDYLAEILKLDQQETPLVTSADYKAVMKRMESLDSKGASFRGFTRTAEAYRPTYEMLKAGTMPKSESAVGRILNRLMGDDLGEGEMREAKVDGSTLPDYKTVRGSLGPAGMFVTAEEDGWLIIGFTLREPN